jgi:hypothetical protein
MSSLFKSFAGALAVGLSVGSSSAGAAMLYNNGTFNGGVGGFTIGGYGGDYAISDSFTLGEVSVVTGFDFGAWTFVGDAVSTIDWGIATTPDNFTSFVAGGTASVINGSPTLENFEGFQYADSTDAFSVGGVNLSAGTYYLVLQNAAAPNGDPVYWDESDGLSSAMSNLIGSLANYTHRPASGSEAFQVFGTDDSDAPEPASWSLMLIGLAGLGASLRGRRAPGGARA